MDTSKPLYTLGTFETTPAMRLLVDQVLNSGRLSYGPLCKQFERKFAKAHGCQYAVLSNSGTSSLQVALQALKEILGWADGDEVLVPSITFVATINVVYHCKLTPVLVDVNPETYAMEPALIEPLITPRTRCIMPIHPFGLVADMPSIAAIADAYDLRIVEDSCEAMGVGTKGVSVGAWGDIGCFSTYVAHFITGGIGGIATTSDQELATIMRSLVNHGIDLDELPTGDAYDPSWLARKFSFSRIGHSFRVTELEAALLLPQLEELPKMIQKRKHNADVISAMLEHHGSHMQLPSYRPGSDHAFMVYPIVLNARPKSEVMYHLRSRGIECRDMLPLTTQPCYDFDPADYPAADWINESGFYIGCHQGLTHEHFEYLAGVFDELF